MCIIVVLVVPCSAVPITHTYRSFPGPGHKHHRVDQIPHNRVKSLSGCYSRKLVFDDVLQGNADLAMDRANGQAVSLGLQTGGG